MIRIAITEAALAAIAKTLPEDTVLHVERRGGQCFIHLKEAIVGRLGAMRGPRATLQSSSGWSRREARA